RRHQTANTVFRITQKCRGYVAFFRREQTDQLPRRGTGQFFQERRAIVRRHLIQNGDDLFVGHRPQQFLLFFDPDIFEDVRGERRWQDAKDDHLFVLGKIENDFRNVRRWPLSKQLAQRAEITGINHALDFWCQKITDHVGVFNTRARSKQRSSDGIIQWWSKGVMLSLGPVASAPITSLLHYSDTPVLFRLEFA